MRNAPEERMRVVVIGGGIAGASAAYELAESADVVLLEREAVCGYHSTGRSAALFTECYGDPVVRRMAMASRPFLARPPEGFTEEDILRPRSVLFVGTGAQHAALQASLDDYRSMVPSVRGVSAEEALVMCPALDERVIVGGIFEPGAQDIDVHALHLGYQQGLRRRGGRILTNAAVGGLRRTSTGWTVESNSGSFDADVVVDAAGAWCDLVGAMAGARPIGLVPKRRTAFTFRPGVEHRSWPMVIDVDEHWYFRPEGVQVLASPADETPTEPVDVRHDEADVALAIQRITAVTRLSIRSVDHAWAGLRSFVADHRPVNGWDSDLPGFYWLAGQGGFGIKTSPAMARFAAGMILHGQPPPDLIAAGITPDLVGVARLR
ncbi:MAG TPA: FAD-binding oxidoreductase [Acidimicrobiia bacterium]